MASSRARGRRRERALPYLLLTPAFLLLMGMLYPFGLGVYYSLTNYHLQYPHLFRFVWLQNYVVLAQNSLLLYSIEFTLGYTAVAEIGRAHV